MREHLIISLIASMMILGSIPLNDTFAQTSDPTFQITKETNGYNGDFRFFFEPGTQASFHNSAFVTDEKSRSLPLFTFTAGETVRITEELTSTQTDSGWSLVDITCTLNGVIADHMGMNDYAQFTANFGDLVECTFINEFTEPPPVCVLPEVLVDGVCVIPTEPPLSCTSEQYSDGTSCIELTVCTTGQYESTAPTETTDRICTDSPTISKQALKESVIADLTILQESTDKKTDKKINKAIKHINHSLKDKLWDDENTLDVKKGKKVFDEEAKAVKQLKKILKKADDSTTTAITTAISTLVDVDRMLAQEAIASVPIDTEDKIVNKELAKAQKALDKAEKQLEKDKPKPDKAIKQFKKAWEHAQHALNHEQKDHDPDDKKKHHDHDDKKKHHDHKKHHDPDD